MPHLAGMNETEAIAILGNANITNTVTEYLGHEALGNAFKHDLTTAVVTSTEPAAGASVEADERVILHVRG